MKQKTKKGKRRKSGTKTDNVGDNEKQGVILRWESGGS